MLLRPVAIESPMTVSAQTETSEREDNFSSLTLSSDDDSSLQVTVSYRLVKEAFVNNAGPKVSGIFIDI
jgi:hypothetical protein